MGGIQGDFAEGVEGKKVDVAEGVEGMNRR
jgi:hypothetical protein